MKKGGKCHLTSISRGTTSKCEVKVIKELLSKAEEAGVTNFSLTLS